MVKKDFKKSVFAATFAALLAIISQITIPTPIGIPVTLQTFAVALYSFIAGPVFAVLAVAVYLGLGLIGLPVFSGFSGGIGALFGFTGGFLWGFLILAALCGIASKLNSRALQIILSFLGLIICHICGILQFTLLHKTELWGSFLSVSLPYIFKDIICVLAAFLVSPSIKNKIEKIVDK
ncbi:MAG: biotin transporter BioY [Oscillospiraceae bacterium]|nr:biotin transporter BioY [Oscillospiraceae bacterium]